MTTGYEPSTPDSSRGATTEFDELAKRACRELRDTAPTGGAAANRRRKRQRSASATTATCRNLAISALRPHGHTNIAKAIRHSEAVTTTTARRRAR